ncbi:hypothetical protein B0H17DRAFT_1216131 [Mycena rosella]|uniref:Uncharacterized protein n=1 Tax=Mycena rosella TaxID=1033263 RepID=A0AAD7FVL6_MYCRO|nr:hypothetical protein B0H17DRAFT_1216131 [Mycena rosella]
MPQLNPGPIRIGSIGYYIPPAQPGDKLDAPQLILVFGWFGADLPGLMKYSTYSNVYSPAAQVLILSDLVSVMTGNEPNAHRPSCVPIFVVRIIA